MTSMGLPSLTISVSVEPQLMVRLSRNMGRFASNIVLRRGAGSSRQEQAVQLAV